MITNKTLKNTLLLHEKFTRIKLVILTAKAIISKYLFPSILLSRIPVTYANSTCNKNTGENKDDEDNKHMMMM